MLFWIRRNTNTKVGRQTCKAWRRRALDLQDHVAFVHVTSIGIEMEHIFTEIGVKSLQTIGAPDRREAIFRIATGYSQTA